MRICHISTVHILGDTRIFHKEIISLAESGCLIDYITKKANVPFNNTNINYHFLPNKKGGINRIFNIYRAFLLALKTNANIYHFHDPELILVGVILKIIKRKKVIYDIHELYFDTILTRSYIPKYLRKFVALSYKWLETFCMPFFDGLVLAENKYWNYYRKKNAIIVQNFFSVKEIPDKRIHFNINNNLYKFTYVGGITRRRGINELIDFIAIISRTYKVSLDLIGPFQEPGFEKIINDSIQNKKLSNNIKLHGQLSYDAAQNIVMKCDIGLIFLHKLKNYINSLPTKLFEYMGNGLVVLMSDFPLWVDFNEKYQAGLTLNIMDLENEMPRVTSFLNDTKKISTIKQNNIKTVKHYFSWEKEFEKLLNLYKALVKNI